MPADGLFMKRVGVSTTVLLAFLTMPLLIGGDGDRFAVLALLYSLLGFLISFSVGRIPLFSFHLLILLTYLFFYAVVPLLTLYYQRFYGDVVWLVFNPLAVFSGGVFILVYSLSYRFGSLVGVATPFSGKKLNAPYRLMAFIFGFWVTALFGRIVLGLYFHASIDPNHRMDAGVYQNILDKLHLLGLAAIPLSLLRYQSTKRRVDLVWAAAFLVISVLAYIPSGSRTLAIAHIPPILLLVLALFGKKVLKSLLVASPVLLATVVLLGNLRVASQDRTRTFEEGAGLLIHRLGDFRNTGRVQERVPADFDFRGWQEMENLWQIFVPFAVRKHFASAMDFNEGALHMEAIGASPGPWTSEPITLIGDLYSRFGWLGIVLGAIALGVAVSVLDKILIALPLELASLFYFLQSRFVFQIYVSSLLVVTVSFVREVAISLLVAFAVRSAMKRLGS